MSFGQKLFSVPGSPEICSPFLIPFTFPHTTHEEPAGAWSRPLGRFSEIIGTERLDLSLFLLSKDLGDIIPSARDVKC